MLYKVRGFYFFKFVDETRCMTTQMKAVEKYFLAVPGGYSQKNCLGVCGPLPKTPSLFLTKICDFPYPIHDLTTLFMTVATGTVALNIIYGGLLLMILSIMMKK